MPERRSDRCIGYWRGSAPGDEALPDPRDHVDLSWDPAERATIASYLKRGLVAGTWRGYSDCRFRCGRPDEQMGHRDLTDGVYVWPEGYAHYVEDHGVRPPATFVAQALTRGVPPGLDRASFIALDAPEREAACARLGAYLTERVRAAPGFNGSVTRLVVDLRAAGHDLWSFDSDGEWELWCADWTKGENPGIVVRFAPGEPCTVDWSPRGR